MGMQSMAVQVQPTAGAGPRGKGTVQRAPWPMVKEVGPWSCVAAPNWQDNTHKNPTICCSASCPVTEDPRGHSAKPGMEEHIAQRQHLLTG